jgi:uncharacterized protein YllA (UPF0747 family)
VQAEQFPVQAVQAPPEKYSPDVHFSIIIKKKIYPTFAFPVFIGEIGLANKANHLAILVATTIAIRHPRLGITLQAAFTII